MVTFEQNPDPMRSMERQELLAVIDAVVSCPDMISTAVYTSVDVARTTVQREWSFGDRSGI